MNKKEEEVQRYYHDTDKSYQHWAGRDEVYEMHYGYRDDPEESHRQSLENLNRKVAEHGMIDKDSVYLDAGCGVGGTSIWVSKNIGAKGHGITLSSLQVQKATEFANKHGVGDLVKYSLQNMLTTNFEDESFDVIWGVESTCAVGDKVALLKEAYRLLKPGGRLVISDYFITKDHVDETDKYCLERFCIGWQMEPLPTKSDFEAFARIVGFRSTTWNNITKNILKSSEEIYKRGVEGMPFDIYRGRNDVQMRHVESNIFQKVALDRNIWNYFIFVGQK